MITRVFDSRVGDHIAKSVLVKLADFANDEGISWPAISRIAHDTEIPERTVKRKLAWLESEGFISRRRERGEGGQYGLTFYMIHDPAPGATVASGNGGTAGQGGQPPGATTRAVPRAFLALQEPSKATVIPPRRPPHPVKADGKAITVEEWDLAQAVLDAWNTATGSNPPFRSTEWIRKIVMRIREHPELREPDYQELITRALGNPWWDGSASPSVVFGNGALFENVLVSNGATKRKRRYGTGVTAGEMGELSQHLKGVGR